MIVANRIVPESRATDASAARPSSHGLEKTRWSFAASVRKPRSRARLVYACSAAPVGTPSPKSINGRCTPSSMRSPPLRRQTAAGPALLPLAQVGGGVGPGLRDRDAVPDASGHPSVGVDLATR